MRAPTRAHPIGVARDDKNLFKGHTQQIGRHLRKTRLMSLTRRLGANDHLNALGQHRHIDTLLGRSDGGLDIIGKSHAPKFAPGLGLLTSKILASPVTEH